MVVVGASAWAHAAPPKKANQVRAVSHHADCGCGHHAPAPLVHQHAAPLASCDDGCRVCRPCCPPLIPALLHGVDRLLQKIFCCSSCGVRCVAVGGRHTPTCGCDAPIVVDHGIVSEYPVHPHVTPGSQIPASQGRYAPAHQRPAPKRGLRETELHGHSVIKRTSYNATTRRTNAGPSRLDPVTGRPVPKVQRVPSSEGRSVTPDAARRPAPKEPVKMHNPLRDGNS